ncbi:MAG: hypothetical protein JSR71_06225 [Proteobacteria bacterium]|nr:hypothetical protein [Pseudomonadota bacterium]
MTYKTFIFLYNVSKTKKMKLFKASLFIGLITLLTVSCKKTDSGTGNAYPKQVDITYRVSSTTANSLVSITYDNETGGQTTANNPALPFTKTITKTVNKYNIITLGYFVNPAQTLKLEILVNNEVVKSQVYTTPNAAMSYTFQ